MKTQTIIHRLLIRRTHNTLFLLIRSFVFVGFFSASLPSHADFQDTMQDMFDSLVNVTSPQAYESQTRHVLASGRVYLRNRVSRPNLLNYTPGRLSGGCGGIDLYLGSFSMINAAEFESLLRNIASNALGYAFGLAIEAMCPTCAQEMKNLQKLVQNMNKTMGDSCEMAESLVNEVGAPLKAWHTKRTEVDKPEMLKNQLINPDVFSGKKDKNKTQGEADNEANVDTSVNAVWQSLKNQNVASWWASGDDELLEIMMSLTGTIIKRPLDSRGGVPCDYGQGPDYCVKSMYTEISFSDLYHGSSGGTIVKKLDCDESAKCLYPVPTDLPDFVGFKARVENILLGDAATGLNLNNLGIVNKIRDKGQRLEDHEIAFIAAVPLPILEMIRNTAVSRGLSEQIARQVAELIAVEMTQNFMEESLQQIYKVVQEEEHEMDSTMLERIERVKKQVNAKHKNVSQQMANVKNYLENYDLYTRKMSERMAIELAENRIRVQSR